MDVMGRMWWMINTKGMNYTLNSRNIKKCEFGYILPRLKIWMLIAIWKIIRFLKKIPLFLSEITGIKILNLAKEKIQDNEFPKATYAAVQAQEN